MPWKNGGGETVEIAVAPPEAGLDGFDWRVSLARVTADGPFSAFPGVDRTLAILDGAGLELTVGAGAAVRLTAASAPFGFPADAPCIGRLLSGPVTDLNTMTRRGRFRHAVTALALVGPVTVGADGGLLLVVCRRGAVAVPGHADLAPHDALMLGGADALEIAPRVGDAEALSIAIRPHTDR